MAFIVLAIVVVLVVGVVIKYNSLISLRAQKDNGWKQIDVQLKRRHDLIPNLVNTVKGEMQFEQETLERVVQARSAAMGATGVADSAAKEKALTDAIGKFFVVMEQYPQLRATENVKVLEEELTSTENKIAFARQFYNDLATSLNIAVQTFPGNIIAGMFNFKAAELFEIAEASERAVPAVDLSLKK